MAKSQPFFWEHRGVISTLFIPLSIVWTCATKLRHMIARPHKADMPVICIGNITSGGTGKTPIVAALAEAAMKRGWQPVILTRGHGGSMTGPLLVNANTTAQQAGDEAVMLHQCCPVVVSRDRAEGARLISAKQYGDLIIMDDGMQNPGIIKDHVLMVFNGRKGVENNRIIPAGPLRESLPSGLKRADAVAITGEDEKDLEQSIRHIDPDAVITRIERMLDDHDVSIIGKKPVITFAGIGDNDGFFTMLEDAGVTIMDKIAFADHHDYSAHEITALMSRAQDAGAILVTTTKDMTRIRHLPDAKNIVAVRLKTTLPTSLLDRILPRR